MPAVIDLWLRSPADLSASPAWLHAAACTLLEGHSTEHTGQDKPFAVGLLRPQTIGAMWRLGWLPDRPPPTVSSSPPIRFGTVSCAVVRAKIAATTYAQLACVGPARSADLQLVSPTYFSRNGRDYPLPDPVLLVESAMRRWNLHAPQPIRVSDEIGRELRTTVHLSRMDGGRTERRTIAPTMTQVGFLGSIRIALTRAASERAARAFGALMRFTATAGIGAQTTHGFGVAELVALDGQRPT